MEGGEHDEVDDRGQDQPGVEDPAQDRVVVLEVHEPAGDAHELEHHHEQQAADLSLELLDGAGQERLVFQTHAPVTVRMHYHAHQRIVRPVFGMAIHHENGVWIYGPNTHFDNVDIPEVYGEGYVDFIIPQLPLLAGRYLISAAVHDQSELHAYDVHDRRFRMIVQSDDVRDRYGMFAIPHRWHWSATDEQQPAASPQK